MSNCIASSEMLSSFYALSMSWEGMSLGEVHGILASDGSALWVSVVNLTMLSIDSVITSKIHVGDLEIDFGTSILNELSNCNFVNASR